MEIRGVRESELAEMIDLQCRGFSTGWAGAIPEICPHRSKLPIRPISCRGGERTNGLDAPCLGTRNADWLYRCAYGRNWRCGDTPRPSRGWLCHSVDEGYDYLHADSWL